MLGFSRESVRFAVKGSLLIANCEIKREELFRLSNLPSVELLYSYEVFEILIIRVDRNRVIGTFEVMPPLFKTINDDKHFLIINFIVLFRFREFA